MTAHVMSEDEVKKISGLVKLELSQDEIEKFRKTIPQTLETIEILKELDTSDIPPTSSVTGLTDVYQRETAGNGLFQKEALANAHEMVNGLFVTSAVLSKS